MNRLAFYIGIENLEEIKNMDNLYLKARLLVDLLFAEKKDKAGKPYLYHLYRVSDQMTTLEGKVAGLLHDVVEDIKTPDFPELDVTFDDLRDIKIPEEIIEALQLVTKTPPPTRFLSKQEKLNYYYQEIDTIIESNNLLAIELKTADMSDNYNPERLSELPEEKKEWFTQKYSEPLKKLKLVKERMITC